MNCLECGKDFYTKDWIEIEWGYVAPFWRKNGRETIVDAYFIDNHQWGEMSEEEKEKARNEWIEKQHIIYGLQEYHEKGNKSMLINIHKCHL